MKSLMVCFSLIFGMAFAGKLNIPLIGVYPPDGVRDAKNIGDRQYILTGGKKTGALVARDLKTGKTVWKVFLKSGSEPIFNKIYKGGFVISPEEHDSGTGMVHFDSFVEIVSIDGHPGIGGTFHVYQVYNGYALVTKECDRLCMADYMIENDRLQLRVVNLENLNIDDEGFLLKDRENCGESSWIDGAAWNIYAPDNRLILELRDKCGQYSAVYDWTQDSKMEPKFQEYVPR